MSYLISQEKGWFLLTEACCLAWELQNAPHHYTTLCSVFSILLEQRNAHLSPQGKSKHRVQGILQAPSLPLTHA